MEAMASVDSMPPRAASADFEIARGRTTDSSRAEEADHFAATIGVDAFRESTKTGKPMMASLEESFHDELMSVMKDTKATRAVFKRREKREKKPIERGFVPVDVTGIYRPEEWGFFDKDPERMKAYWEEKAKPQYQYQRAARRSVFEEMEVSPNSSRNLEAVEKQLAVYQSIVSETDAAAIFLAFMVGNGSSNLPSAFNNAGLVPGLVFIAGLATTNLFLCNRLLEVPELLEQNFENYFTIIRPFWNSQWILLIAAVSCVTWFATAVLNVSDLVEPPGAFKSFIRADALHVQSFFSGGRVNTTDTYTASCNLGEPGEDQWGIWGWVWRVTVCFILLLVSMLGQQMGLIRWAARLKTGITLSLGACFSIAAIVMVAMGTDRFSHIRWIGRNVMLGFLGMLYAYLGAGILPYTVAEMQDPSRARRTVNWALKWITVFYLVYGLCGYAALGQLEPGERDVNIIATLPVKWACWLHELSADGSFWLSALSRTCIYLIYGLLALKALASFPLMFWPLVRETQVFLNFMASPGIEIELPWAWKQRKRTRDLVRYIIAFCVGWPLTLPAHLLESITLFCVGVPMTITHLMAPALLACFAAVRHKHISRFKEVRRKTMDRIRKHGYNRQSTAFRVRPKKKEFYFMRDYRWHLAACFAVATLTVGFVGFVLIQWGCASVFASLENTSLCETLDFGWRNFAERMPQ